MVAPGLEATTKPFTKSDWIDLGILGDGDSA